MFRALVCTFTLLLCGCAGHAAEFYVAPGGSDAGPGTKARPFATLERARDAARQARAGGQQAQPARVVVRGGVSYLAAPLQLGPEDSNLTIEGAPGESAVISGGRRVTGWKPWKGKILQADLSSLGLPDLNVRELYYEGKMMPWARVPNFDPKHPRTGGFLQNAGVVEKDTKTKFRYR